jgi:hypothetical protein
MKSNKIAVWMKLASVSETTVECLGSNVVAVRCVTAGSIHFPQITTWIETGSDFIQWLTFSKFVIWDIIRGKQKKRMKKEKKRPFLNQKVFQALFEVILQ